MTISKRLYANNAKTSLSIDIAAIATTIQVVDGSRFPNPNAGHYFLATFELGTSVEVVKVTSRVGNIFYGCLRGQEGTTALGFASGTRVENRVTKNTLEDFEKLVDRLSEVSSIDVLDIPLNSNANSYLCHSNDSGGSPMIAMRNTDYNWRLSSHSLMRVGGTVDTGGLLTLTSSSIGDMIIAVAEGKYVVQLTTGVNAGLCRWVTDTGTDSVSWSTPMPVTCSPGDKFEVYKSNASILAESEIANVDQSKAPKISPIFSGQATIADGTAVAPGLTFADSNTGLYHPEEDTIGISCGTIPQAIFTPTGINVPVALTVPTVDLGTADLNAANTTFVQNKISGVLYKAIVGGPNVVLTDSEAGNGILILQGVLTTNISVIVPNVSGKWYVNNTTTGAYSITVKTAIGTGVVISSGYGASIVSDGVNVFLQQNDFIDTLLKGTPSLVNTPSVGDNSHKLADTAYVNTALVSMVAHFPTASAPAGWLKANGAIVSRVTYAALFAIIGTTFGAGNGSSTFSLPDFRGQFLRGLSDGSSYDVGRILGSTQGDQNQSHSHVLNDPGHAHSVWDPTHSHTGYTSVIGNHQHGAAWGESDPGPHGVTGSGGHQGSSSTDWNNYEFLTSADGTHSHSIQTYGAGTGIGIYGAGTGMSMNASGGGEVRVRNVALLICIKY